MDMNKLKIPNIGMLSYENGTHFLGKKEVTTPFLVFCNPKNRLKFQIRKHNFETMK
jgi:hypothetical protein